MVWYRLEGEGQGVVWLAVALCCGCVMCVMCVVVWLMLTRLCRCVSCVW